MILRRVIEHVKAQNWTAVALDFVIVVVGVFIGIQVSNWNDARAERSREETYLTGVAEDLRSDMIEIDAVIAVSASRMAALDLLLEKTGKWSRPADFASSRGVAEIQTIEPFDETGRNTIGGELFILNTLDGNRFAYETLINTGGIGIIRDKVLVRDIQNYYASVDKARRFELSLEESRARLIDAQQAVGISFIDGATAEELAPVFRDNAPLAAAAKNYWIYANRHLILMHDLKGEAQTLASRIESEVL